MRVGWVSPGATPGSGAATSYAIWRVDGTSAPAAGDLVDATNLVATVRRVGQGSQSFLDAAATPGAKYTYVVTALDRLWHESAPSEALRI